MRGPALIEEAIKMAKECEVDEPTAYIMHHPSLCADRLRGFTEETIWTKATGSFLQSRSVKKAVEWLARRDAAIEANDAETYLPMYKDVAIHYAKARMARYPELEKLTPQPPKRRRRSPADPQEPNLSQSEMDNAIRYLDPEME